ncbi:hypothetical protein [Streptomyces sp. NPDC059781]|uniref:hypothetical protein n=1 Tax=unclassified Streptomyces TaxID=2593676 RepID=UPI003656EBA7
MPGGICGACRGERAPRPPRHAPVGIDRDSDTVKVYSEPKNGRYQQSPSYPWGTTVVLPSPVDITLDTEELKEYAD